jgi:hypothetical protein
LQKQNFSLFVHLARMVLVFTLIIANTTTKLMNFKHTSLSVAVRVIFVMNRLIKSTKYCESATEGGKVHFVKIRCELFD